MTAERRRRRVRGQSSIEFAMIAPLLFLLLLGASDLAQSFYLSIETNGAARAGMRDAVQSDSVDLGEAVRSEPNTAIKCTPETWGQVYEPCGVSGGAGYCASNPGQCGTNSDCDGPTQACGDPQGCDPIHSSFWRTPGPGTTTLPSACFAVQACTKTVTAGAFTCSYNGAWNSGTWNTRPTGCTSTCSFNGIVIKVVYKYTPNTPLIASLVAGTGGSFYLTQIVTGMQVY